MKRSKLDVIASINNLTNKSMDDEKYVYMRDGERPKKGARVIADGKPGEVEDHETVEAPTHEGNVKDHLVVDVKHPEGTTTSVDGVGKYGHEFAPDGGFSKKYAGDRVRVHQDDILAKK